jgi:CheY-like chemotaxis protein
LQCAVWWGGVQVKIVIVDDDRYKAELLSEMLTRFVYECKTATNGREALDLLHDDTIY